MLFKKIVSFVILAAAAASSLAATTYPVKHGSLVAGESVKVEGAGGAKIFFPTSVGGTPIAGEYGAIVSTDNVPGMGIQVRSGLTAAPRDKKTWLYIDSNGKMYLSSYDMVSSNPSFATALNSQPVELDSSKYPGLLSATNVFPTYLSAANNITYYLSGTNLYKTNALKKGAANSEVSTLVSSNASAAIGVDDGVFVNSPDGAFFYRADGVRVGLSSMFGGGISESEFSSIVSIHPSYFVLKKDAGDHVLFAPGIGFSKNISDVSRGGFIPYYSRSAQLAGHSGQTAFAWWDGDYIFSYIDPYGTDANALRTMNWSAMSGLKITRANIVKLLSVSEDGFVQYTGKNATATTFYMQIAGKMENLGAIVSTSSTLASDATEATASSVAWSNPSNPNWHYKVPPATFGSSGTKAFYWRWSLSATTGKYSLTKTTSTSPVNEYSAGGRVCTTSSSANFATSKLDTQVGSGTTTISGPSNTCGTLSITTEHAGAANLQAGLTPIGAADYSYINGSGSFSRISAFKNLAALGDPPTLTAALGVPENFTGTAAWDANHNIFFGVGSNGLAYFGGELISVGVGSSLAAPIPIVNKLVGVGTSDITPSSLKIGWNDPRDARMGSPEWTVKSSRKKSSVAFDELTSNGNDGTRLFNIDPQADGFTHTFDAEASIAMPVLGHRGASIKSAAASFVASVARPPVLSAPTSVALLSNAAQAIVEANATDSDLDDVVSLSISVAATNGTASIANGKVSYQPNADYIGSDSFSIRATDKYGLYDEKTISIIVSCPEPVLSGFLLDSNRVGPYMGSTGTLSYSANSCNGAMAIDYVIKRSSDDLIANQKTVLVSPGDDKSDAYVFSDIPPGNYVVSAKITSQKNVSLNKTVTAVGGLKVDPVGVPVINLSKASVTEDDFVTASIGGVENCTLFNTVSEARINKGCHVEWVSSAGLHSVAKTSAGALKFGGFRGAQNLTATVSAYNIDGASTSMGAANLNFPISTAVDVNVNVAFSKAGQYLKFVDKVGVTLSGNPSNLCTLHATNAQASASISSGNNACVLTFDTLPQGVLQKQGTLELAGRIMNPASNKINYSIHRYISDSTSFVINTGAIDVPVVDSTYTASIETSATLFAGKQGLQAKFVLQNLGAVTAAETTQNAMDSWASDGAPQYLVEWSNYSAGLSPVFDGGAFTLAGVPGSSGNQSSMYRAYLMHQDGTQFDISSGTLLLDSAPQLIVPAQVSEIPAESSFSEISGITYSDADVGDVYALKIKQSPNFGTALISAGGKLQYKPNTGYVGFDQVKLQVVDKFGAFNEADVALQVMCSLPSSGSVTRSFTGSPLFGKPLNFNATYGPVLPCHGGYNTKIEFIDSSTGQVALSVNAPTSSISLQQADLTYSNEDAFNGITLPAGTYSTRLTVESKDNSANKKVFDGQQFFVLPMPTISIASDNLNPTEDDSFQITASAISGCVYYPTIAEARSNDGCFIEWVTPTSVKEFSRVGGGGAKISARRGSQTIVAKIRSYNSNGTFYSIPDVSHQINVQSGAAVVLTPNFSKAGAYKQFIDSVSATVSSENDCQLYSSLSSAISGIASGNRACIVEFTSVPNGIKKSGLSISGRLIDSGVQTVAYQVSRVYSDGTTFLINNSDFAIPYQDFSSSTILKAIPTAFGVERGYTASLDISSGGWNCSQTNNLTSAMSAWNNSGELPCFVEWGDLKDGISISSSDGKVIAAGTPLTSGDQTISYKVSIVNESGNFTVISEKSNETISASPSIMGDSFINLKANSQPKLLGGFSLVDNDQVDLPVVSVSKLPAHGSVSFSQSAVSYEPEPSYVGADSFTLKATDNFGAFSRRDIAVGVSCPMPTSGTIGVVGDSVKSIGRPVNFEAQIIGTESCNNGFVTVLKIIDDNNGSIAKTISIPTSSIDGINAGGEKIIQLTFDAASFGAGSYRSKLLITSNSNPSNFIELDGGGFTVNGFGAPILRADKASPSEDDLVTVVSSNSACSTFVSTEEQARTTPNSCLMSWSKTGNVTSIATTGADRVSIRGVRGNGVVTGTLNVADNDGAIIPVGSEIIAFNFTASQSAPVIRPVFDRASYSVLSDYVMGSIQSSSGGLDCTIVDTKALGVAQAALGNKACLVTFKKIPVGIKKDVVGQFFDGRFTSIEDSTFNYSVSRIFADGTQLDYPDGSFTASVNSFGLSSSITSSSPSFVAGVQSGTISAKAVNASTGDTGCVLTSDASVASASWTSLATPKCLLTWVSMPNGMSLGGDGVTLTGVPSSPQDNLAAYRIEFIDDSGDRYLGATGSERINIVPAISPSFTLSSSAGRFQPSDGSEPSYLVMPNGAVGSMVVSGAGFSNIVMRFSDSALPDAPVMEDNSMVSGQSIGLITSARSQTPFTSRSALIYLGYRGYGNTLSTSTPIKLMGIPDGISAQIQAPKSLIDTLPASVTVKVGLLKNGVLTYNQATNGMWAAFVAEKIGSTIYPITAKMPLSSVDGSITFTGISPEVLKGKSIVAVAEPFVAGGEFVDFSYSIQSPSVAIQFLPGGAIPAVLSTTRSSGSVPFATRFDVVLENQYRDDIKSISYEYSLNGGDWILMGGLSGFGGSHVFQSGGIYKVRAVITNKNTLAISQTEPITLTVKQTLKMSVTANTMELPGATVTMVASAVKPDGQAVSYEVEWEVIRQGAPTEIITGQNSIALTSNNSQVININVKARPSELPADDPASWVSMQRLVTFAAAEKPRVSITAPAFVEAGTPQVFSVRLIPTWPADAQTSMKLTGKWVLPNGTEVPGVADLSWAPSFDDVASGGEMMVIRYVAWVDGAESTSSIFVDKKIFVKKYEFPNFTLSTKSDSGYAPAFVTLAAIPATPLDGKLMLGKKFTYTWSIPSGVIGKVGQNKFSGSIDMPGDYSFTVKVSDERGNEQSLNGSFSITESRPYSMTLKSTLAQKFERPTAKYALKIDLFGGHPKDRVKSYKLFIDDVLVTDFGVNKPAIASITSSGSHVIKVLMESVMGAFADASQTVTLVENQVPTCTLNEFWDSKGRYVSVKSVCKDLDGALKKFQWFVDGVLQVGKSSTSFVWIPANGATTANIKVVVTDDSGETGFSEKLVTKP